MAERVAQADLILEGEVLSIRSSWNMQRNMIYSVSHVRAYKVFKGITTISDLDIVTEGGRDGLDMIESTNEWKPVVGQQEFSYYVSHQVFLTYHSVFGRMSSRVLWRHKALSITI